MRVEVFSKMRAMFLPVKSLHLAAGLLVLLELGSELEQRAPLLGREVELLEEVAVVQGVGHEDSFVLCVVC